jgi:twitching motility protein PilI
LGLANIRGVLASVVDFGAFMGGEATARTPDCRLMLIAERFQSFSGLLISRMLGLKNIQALGLLQATGDRPWVGASYSDEEGHVWQELNLAELTSSNDFLQVGVV